MLGFADLGVEAHERDHVHPRPCAARTAGSRSAPAGLAERRIVEPATSTGSTPARAVDEARHVARGVDRRPQRRPAQPGERHPEHSRPSSAPAIRFRVLLGADRRRGGDGGAARRARALREPFASSDAFWLISACRDASSERIWPPRRVPGAAFSAASLAVSALSVAGARSGASCARGGALQRAQEAARPPRRSSRPGAGRSRCVQGDQRAFRRARADTVLQLATLSLPPSTATDLAEEHRRGEQRRIVLGQRLVRVGR